MPVTVEVKHEYFNTWAGRIKIIEVVSAYLFVQILNSIFIYGFTLFQSSDFGLAFEIIGYLSKTQDLIHGPRKNVCYISISREQNAICNCVIT